MGLQDQEFFPAYGSRRSANGDARAGTLRHADRSANDGDRVRHGFDSGDLRGVYQGRELKLVVEWLNTYLQLHYILLTLFETKARNLLAEAINHVMDERFHALAV